MTSRTEASADGVGTESSLRARLRIEPHRAASCAVLESGDRGEEVNRDEICRHGTCGDGCGCRAEVEVTEGERRGRRLVATSIDEYCVCPAFRRNDCVFDIESFRDGALFVSVSVPTRGALRDLVEDLRAREASVHLERILPLSAHGETRTIELDATAVTDKQREAIEAAVRAGYYDSPRQADLNDLADELNVSRSAVSQRLNAAESTLVRELTSVESADPDVRVASD